MWLIAHYPNRLLYRSIHPLNFSWIELCSVYTWINAKPHLNDGTYVFASEAKSIAARYWFLLSFLLSSNQMNRARQPCLLLIFPFGILNSFLYKSTFDWIVGFTLELFANFIRIFAIEKREFHITRSTMRQRDVNFIWKYFCIIIEFDSNMNMNVCVHSTVYIHTSCRLTGTHAQWKENF